MNQSFKEIYEDYRDEMVRTLAAEELYPHKFEIREFVEHFAQKVDRLDTLIALYADLMLANRN